MFFAVAVLAGESDLEVKSRLYIGNVKGAHQMMSNLSASIANDEDTLLMLRRVAPIDAFEEGDFDAPIDLTPLKNMEMLEGRLAAMDPYPGKLGAPLVQSGVYIAFIEVAPEGAAPMGGLIAAKADTADEALLAIMNFTKESAEALQSIEGLMDASLHADDGYEFQIKPSALAAKVSDAQPVVMGDMMAFEDD